MDFETVDPADFGTSLTGIGINLLVRDVQAETRFLTQVFHIQGHRISADFAIRRQTRPSTPAAWFCSHPRTNRTVCANVISYVPMAMLGCLVWRSKVKQNQRSGEAQHAVQTAASYLKYRRLGSIFIDDVCPARRCGHPVPIALMDTLRRRARNSSYKNRLIDFYDRNMPTRKRGNKHVIRIQKYGVWHRSNINLQVQFCGNFQNGSVGNTG